MQKSIIIDATKLGTKQPTGVELYVDNLLPELTSKLSESGLKVICLVYENVVDLSAEIIKISYKSGYGQIGLVKLLNKLKPDLFFTPSTVPPILWRGKSIFTLHDMSIYKGNSNYSLGQKIRLKWLSKLASIKAVKIITPSEYTKSEINRIWQISCDKIESIPLGYSPSKHLKSKEINDLPTDLPILLYIGRVELKKNLQTILHSFAKVFADIPCRLVIVGKPGFGYDQIILTYKNLPEPLKPFVKILSYIKDEEKEWLYNQASLVLAPCPIEGFGLNVLEAFDHKKPLIIADEGGLLEVAGDACMKASPFIPDDWSAKILHVLKDENLQRELITNGINRLDQYSWHKTTEETANLIIKTLKDE